MYFYARDDERIQYITVTIVLVPHSRPVGTMMSLPNNNLSIRTKYEKLLPPDKTEWNGKSLLMLLLFGVNLFRFFPLSRRRGGCLVRFG